jgi:hypothetical protein
MSVRKLHASTAGSPLRIEVANPAGSVTIESVERADSLDARVEALDDAAEELLERVDIEVSDDDPDSASSPVRLRVTVPERRLSGHPTFAVRITTPPGADARVAVASAEVELRGRFADVHVTGASGDLAVDEASELELRTASGDVRVGTVHGRAFLRSASGDIRIGRVGDMLQVRGASGDVSIEHAADASISTASGDVTVGTAAGGMLQVKTASGDIAVGVPPGLRVYLDLHSVSGRMRSHLDEDVPRAGEAGPDLTLNLESVSGDLRIARAAPVPAV